MRFIIFTLLFSLNSIAFAIPVAPHKDFNFSNKFESDNGYDFEGIVALSNCSGSLIKFEGQDDSSKAIVMTNGHCLGLPTGFLKPGEVIFNKAIKHEMGVFKTLASTFKLTATKIIYATMTSTDVAFYELTESYSEIFAKTNVTPLTLSSVKSTVQTEIEILSGYWRKGYSCAIDGFVFKIREGDWTFLDSIRYTSTCDTIGGTSGSPILEKGTRTVVGINNTSNENGVACAVNSPCEVNEAGHVMNRPHVRYGQQTYLVYTCLDKDFKIDLKMEGCLLPK